MVKVASARSDEILVLDTEVGTRKYEKGGYIEFKTDEGFHVKGVIAKVGVDTVEVFSDDTYSEYKISSISEVPG